MSDPTAPATEPEPQPGRKSWLQRLSERATPVRVGLLVAAALAAFQLARIEHYGLTSDSPSLFYAGDRTLFWLTHPKVPGALDFKGGEPAGFKTVHERFPDPNDPLHYPVLPGFLGAVTSALFHDRLGWVDSIPGHHIALVLLNALAVFLFCIYACALFGPAAGIAATLILALFPTAIGHAPNNAKDWPCAQFYGLTVMAVGLSVLRDRARHMLAAGVFFGIAMSAKMNAAFILPTLIAWLPLAWLLVYRRRAPLSRGLVGATEAMPVIGFVVFFICWPWLYYGRPLDWWEHLYEYVRFMLAYGGSNRPTWTDYPLRGVLFMTPPLVLLAALYWLFAGWALKKEREDRAAWSLLAIWFLLPIVRIAAPRSNFYDANRHFIEYVPALAALSGIGAVDGASRLLAWLRRIAPAAARFAPGAFVAVGLAAVVWPVAAYHPYETTYFNFMIGGLGGAQQKALFDMPSPPADKRVTGTEGDYWSSSLRDALADLRSMVKPGEKVAVCGMPGPVLAGLNQKEHPVGELLDWWHPEYYTAPYFLLAPRETLCWWREIREHESLRPVIKRVERGGGLIYEILGPPSPTPLQPVSKRSRYEDRTAESDGVGHKYDEAKRVANGRPVVKRWTPNGIVTYDVVDPVTGETVWKQPVH